MGMFLFLVGICLIVYPWVERYWQEQQQLELLTHWEHLQAEMKSTITRSHAKPINPLLRNKGESAGTEQPEREQSELMNHSFDLKGQTMLGIINIDKIDVREPMLEGTTKQALKLGIGTVEPDRQLGEVGNFVLAGHRSWTYGHQFNRLDELADGDEITIITEDKTYTYEVTSKFVVTPDDLSVLEEDAESSEITLITCEPLYTATHRLIVKAELKENLEN